MPAVSKAQQRFMGMVHAADKGETPASPEVAKVSKNMDDKAAKDFASTKHTGLPDHVREALKEIVRGVIRENYDTISEMSPNDVHFRHIIGMFDKGGSFTKKKVASVVTKNPNSNRNKIIDYLQDMDYSEIIDVEDELGIHESINEVEYKDAVEKFNADLMKNSQVERIAKHHKRSVKDVVKALQPYLKVLRYSDKSIRVVSIDFRDTNSDVKVHASHTYQQNESIKEDSHDCGCNENHDCGCGGLHEHSHINEDIKNDVNKFLDKLNKEFPEQEYTTDFKGGKYARIVQQSRKYSGNRSAWGFISMEDNPSKGFKKGDLLKAAGFNAPAKGARGNILDGTARYGKWSPVYLK